jgi:hypothetical protein
MNGDFEVICANMPVQDPTGRIAGGVEISTIASL